MILYFDFFPGNNIDIINLTHRFSIWFGQSDYLMPSQFKDIQRGDYYEVKVNVLDPDNYVQNKHIGYTFFFGNPGKIIGHGLLKKIENS